MVTTLLKFGSSLQAISYTKIWPESKYRIKQTLIKVEHVLWNFSSKKNQLDIAIMVTFLRKIVKSAELYLVYNLNYAPCNGMVARCLSGGHIWNSISLWNVTLSPQLHWCSLGVLGLPPTKRSCSKRIINEDILT